MSNRQGNILIIFLISIVSFASAQKNWKNVRELEQSVRYSNPQKLLEASTNWIFEEKSEPIYREWLFGLQAWYESDYAQSYNLFSSAYKSASLIPDSALTIEIGLDLARVYSILEQTGKSLTMLLDLESFVLNYGNDNQKARYFIQLGELYRRISEFDKALDNINKSKAYISNNEELYCYYLNRKAAIYTETLKHEKSKKYSREALNLATKINHPHYIAISYNELAFLNRHTKQQDSVFYYYSKADSIWSAISQWRYASAVKLELSIWYAVHETYKDLNISKHLAHDILNILKDKDWSYMEHKVYGHLSNLNLELGFLDSANYYSTLSLNSYIIYSEKRNEIFTSIVEAEYLHQKNEALIREQELIIAQESELNRQIKNQNHLYTIVITITSLVIFLLILLIKMNINKRSKALETAKKEALIRKNLEENLEENQLLLAEVNHRVKNNLQTMLTLLDLQKINTQSKLVKDSLIEAQRRLEAMGIVHEMLYSNDHINKIDLYLYIQNLIESEKAIYEHPMQLIQFKLKVEKILLDMNQCINIGMIISEFISNSFKHAFKNIEDPTIEIVLTQKEDDVQLLIRDNGIGLNNHIVNDEKLKSLGLKLISIFCKKLNATQQITGSEKGTEMIINFKI